MSFLFAGLFLLSTCAYADEAATELKLEKQAKIETLAIKIVNYAAR